VVLRQFLRASWQGFLLQHSVGCEKSVLILLCVLRAPSPWLGIVRVGAELGPETPAERSVGARSRYPDPGHINDVASASWDHCLGAQFIVGSKRGQGCT
jgi:hypothetical protein